MSATQTDTGIVPGTTIKAQYEWSQRNKKCLLAPLDFDGGAPVDAGTRDATSDGRADSGPPRDAGAAGSSGNGGAGGATGSTGGGGGVSAGGSAGTGVAGGPGAGGVAMGTGGVTSGTTSGPGGSSAAEDAGRPPARREPAADDGGCSCHLGGISRAGAGSSALFLAALLGLRRRRRRG